MPLRVEKLWQEYNTQAAFTVASLLALLAVVTLVVKTSSSGRRGRTSDEVRTAASRTKVSHDRAFSNQSA